MTAVVDTPAAVELFGLLWDPADNPIGHALAVATAEAHAVDDEATP